VAFDRVVQEGGAGHVGVAGTVAAEDPEGHAQLDQLRPTEIESFRALARYAPEAASRLPALLDQIELIGLDPPIRILAQTARPATVRSLDAIHLGNRPARPPAP
jgi:hypothetical protein